MGIRSSISPSSAPPPTTSDPTLSAEGLGGLLVMRTARLWLALVLAVATATAHRAMPIATLQEGDERFVPRPAVARVLSFGFEAVVADFHWLHAVQIVGGTHRGLNRHSARIGRLVDVATTLNPWMDHPYRFAAVWLTDSVESVRTANTLLQRGISYH